MITKNHRIFLSKADKTLKKIIEDNKIPKISKSKDFVLDLYKYIIFQQISTKAAESITRRFHGLFTAQNPTPEEVVRISKVKLRNAGLSGQKVKYLKDLGARFLDGSIRPHRLTYQNNEEVIETLTSVYGIGRWTAEMFLIFSLNRIDVLPLGDLGLKAGIKKIYNMRSLPSPKKMLALGKKWHPMETVGTWYAWRIQDAEIITY